MAGKGNLEMADCNMVAAGVRWYMLLIQVLFL